ncbi:hypothetical protein Tco_0873775 [Tanacetum coccineum]|uniref:Secreted protein n=1 Tax=Tanacetum coccineum TaxID=301880 RepID=A0ABQ5BQE4_9ASTR
MSKAGRDRLHRWGSLLLTLSALFSSFWLGSFDDFSRTGADVAGSFLPNLLNTPPSFRGRGHGEGDLYFLSLLKTLACGDGLRECLSPCLLRILFGRVGVLDSE